MSGYSVEVARREVTAAGYASEPYHATARLGKALVAIKYGPTPGTAFQKAWNAIQEDREREGVVVNARL